MIKPLRLICVCAALLGVALAAPLPLVPYPRQLTQQPGALRLRRAAVIAVPGGAPADRFAAQTLANELSAIDGVAARVAAQHKGAGVVLLRAQSAAGRAALRSAALTLPPEARDQGYALIVTPRRATVVAATAEGVFYGVQTLRQLFHPVPGAAGRAAGAEAPAVSIVDWPAFAHRGISVDISRGAVPTLASMKRDVALLAEFKLNVYSLYFENTFEYQSLPLVGAFGGAITPAEARELVAYARNYHVEIVPDQESFGHLHLALQYERFQDIAELPYGSVLTPTVPGSMEFIEKMFGDLAAVFPSPYLHIGADETYELGQGKTKALADQLGGGQVFVNYLKQIDAALRPYHRQVLFWGDIAVKHPELLSQLPHDMIALPWVYSPEPSFVRYIQPFRAAGLETWVSPGVNNWSRIAADNNLALPNIKQFTADGLKLGATGVLNTTWMDDGESMFNYCWYGVTYGAAASWQPSVDDQQFADAYDWAFFRADGHEFSHDIAQFAAIHNLLKQATGSDGEDWTTWLDPFSPRGQAYYAKAAPAAHQVRLLAEDVIASLATHRGEARRNAELLDWTDFSARRFDFLGQKALYTEYIGQLYDQARQAASAQPPQRGKIFSTLNRINGVNGLLEDLRDASSELMNRYQALWLAENRPYFLDNILIRYQDELRYWQSQATRFSDIAAFYRRGGELPPLVAPPPGQPKLVPGDTRN
ncbi:MAG: glycoside hydrolase family 20 zincin-like fold domain-containing protein [Terriglobales bacterium]